MLSLVNILGEMKFLQRQPPGTNLYLEVSPQGSRPGVGATIHNEKGGADRRAHGTDLYLGERGTFNAPSLFLGGDGPTRASPANDDGRKRGDQTDI